MKIKDTIYVILFFVAFISIIGLLMAWSDGYLDGTIIASILSVLAPVLLCLYLIAVVVTWIKNKLKK